jgi:hypothetical protein
MITRTVKSDLVARAAALDPLQDELNQLTNSIQEVDQVQKTARAGTSAERQLQSERAGYESSKARLEARIKDLPFRFKTTDVFEQYLMATVPNWSRLNEEERTNAIAQFCIGTDRHATKWGYSRPATCDITQPMSLTEEQVGGILDAHGDSLAGVVTMCVNSCNGVLRESGDTGDNSARLLQYARGNITGVRGFFSSSTITRGANVADVTVLHLGREFLQDKRTSAVVLHQALSRVGRAGLSTGHKSRAFIHDPSALFRYARWLMPDVFTSGRDEALARYAARIQELEEMDDASITEEERVHKAAAIRALTMFTSLPEIVFDSNDEKCVEASEAIQCDSVDAAEEEASEMRVWNVWGCIYRPDYLHDPALVVAAPAAQEAVAAPAAEEAEAAAAAAEPEDEWA